MPSRPTARCCRAVQHQIRAPLDNVWITDGVLANAFERYCHVSQLARRKSSSLPGPLESRRRLGKRKMTDLHMDTQSTLPPWASDFPIDLSQWKWQPPTLRSSEEKRALQSQREPSEQSWISAWIPGWRADKARLEEKNADQTSDEQAASEITFSEQLSQARSAVEASTPTAIDPSYYNFIGGLQQDLKLGLLDRQDVQMAVSAFPPSLIDTEAHRDVANAAVEMFLSAVVNGIASSKVLGPSEFDGSFWNLVLNRISQLHANDATTLLFQTTLDAVPRKYVNDAHEGIVAAVQKLAVFQSTGRRRAADIGAALRELSPDDHGALLSGMEVAVYEGSAAFDDKVRQKLRFLWLQILAHMPRVNQDYLLDACVRSAYFDRQLPYAAGRDLSRLLIQQWASRGYLQRQKAVEASWDRDCSAQAELSLAALVINICGLEPSGFRHGQRVALLMSLLKALRRIGRHDELLASIKSFCEAREQVPILPFKLLALASGEYNTALRVLALMEAHATKLDGKVELLWDWTAWTSYVEDMIKDEAVQTATIWKVVDSGAARSFRSPAQRELLMKRRTKLMENMAVWFSQASHRTDRMALRHVSRCISWLRAHNVPLSRKVMLAAVSVVTRELKRGEPGRTRRLGWILDLIERYQGVEERRAVAQVLRRWRKGNGEQDAARRQHQQDLD
ncbi:hypothetical protein CCHL11_08680 [Colletotrichum chlorophyti]|uniref:Uncharacterized protein n=1 Tax=Colletotrichum chlorophyti TaxID=708187 RepID=A0A1Q8RCI0_9PEZI|nr:hypothetical protein CCHL11_08680 [Colletotrichum chlorophyti]